MTHWKVWSGYATSMTQWIGLHCMVGKEKKKTWVNRFLFTLQWVVSHCVVQLGSAISSHFQSVRLPIQLITNTVRQSVWLWGTFKGIVHIKDCHHLLPFMLFQICMSSVLVSSELYRKPDTSKVWWNIHVTRWSRASYSIAQISFDHQYV